MTKAVFIRRGETQTIKVGMKYTAKFFTGPRLPSLASHSLVAPHVLGKMVLTKELIIKCEVLDALILQGAGSLMLDGMCNTSNITEAL